MKITTLVSLALLTGCAAEDSFNHDIEVNAVSAKASSALVLEVSDLHAGYLSNLTVSGADAFESLYLFQSSAGIGAGECARILAGECFGLLGVPRAWAYAEADKDGNANFLVAPRLGMVEGTEINYQVVALRAASPAVLSNAEPAAVAIASSNFTGNYTDQFAWEATITPNYMSDQYGNFWHITDEGADFNISYNDGDNNYNPGLWTRSDFAQDGDGNLYMCMSTYDADTEAQALAGTPADSSDFEAGCGGFAWSLMTYNPLAITGAFTDDWGTAHEIDGSLWSDSWGSEYEVYSYTNEYNYLIAQNSATNSWNPGLWSRFDWFEDAKTGDTYYCQSAYDGATPARAIVDGLMAADSTDLVSGCGGFSWTNLTP